MSVIMDGWTMLPIADADATTHIIAARNDDEALATDIDVVVYEKTPDGWSGSAYDPSVTKEDAFIDIANEFGLSDPFDGTWQIDLDEEDVFGFVLPRIAFGKGFFVTDPLYEIANHVDDPEPLAEGAEGAGLPAGSGAVNTGTVSGGSDIGGPLPNDGCGCEACIQVAIAAGADAMLLDPEIDIQEVDSIIGASLETAVPCCVERVVCGRIRNGAWNCSGWTFTGMDPTPGGVTCRYTRNVFRGQTQRCVKVCPDCTSTVFVRSRIESGTEEGSTTALNPAACTPPPAGGCGSIVQNQAFTPWGPPPPACP